MSKNLKTGTLERFEVYESFQPTLFTGPEERQDNGSKDSSSSSKISALTAAVARPDAAYNVNNATFWVQQFCRDARQSMGIGKMKTS